MEPKVEVRYNPTKGEVIDEVSSGSSRRIAMTLVLEVTFGGAHVSLAGPVDGECASQKFEALITVARDFSSIFPSA